MYDTLTILLKEEDYNGGSLLDYDNNYEWIIAIDNNGTIISKTTITDNYKINVNCNRIIINQFSLSKYYFGCNIYTLNINQVRLAFKKLENELNLPLEMAQLSRIDFSTVFEVNQKPTSYFPLLSRLSRFRRVEYQNTLYFRTDSIVILFYDKIKHLKSKTPIEFLGKNMLRYEFRLKNSLKKLFGHYVTVPMLYDEIFFNKLIEMYKDFYKRIEKDYAFDVDYSNVKTPKDVISLIVSIKTNMKLDTNKIIENTNLNSKGKYRARELIRNYKQGHPHPLISELNYLILNL